MDWFTALEAPTQVAIVGVLAGLVTAAAAVTVAIVNNRRAGGGRAEIAALTVDSSSIKLVASAIEASNITMAESNALAKSHFKAVERLAKATEDLAEGVDDLKNEVIRSAAKLK